MTATQAAAPMGLRRALMVASAERYLVLVINFALMALVSRQLTPAEIGLAVLGTAVLSIAETLRDVGIVGYLAQDQEVRHERVRTAFTAMLAVSVLLAAGLVLLAGPLAARYQEPVLRTYLHLLAAGILIGPFSAPGLALLRRDMAFGRLAAVNLAATLASTAVTLGLVLGGAGALSFAWGGIAWAAAAAAMTFRFRPEAWMFRPLFRGWRSMLAFGGTNAAIAILNRAYEVLPFFILGRVLSADAIGLYSRAVTVSQLADKFVLLGLGPVALPAFAAEARAGRGLAVPYLRALTYISGLQWPALVMTALLAHPMVLLLLGPQWLASVPLVSILAIAAMAMFAAPLTYPVLVACGAIRHALLASLISLPPSAAILIGAAQFGLQALAWSALPTLAFQAAVAIHFVRRNLGFRWAAFGRAVAPSLGVTALTALPPLAVVLASANGPALSFGEAALALLGGGLGWLGGVFLLRHPLAGEAGRLAAGLQQALMPVSRRAWRGVTPGRPGVPPARVP